MLTVHVPLGPLPLGLEPALPTLVQPLHWPSEQLGLDVVRPAVLGDVRIEDED